MLVLDKCGSEVFYENEEESYLDTGEGGNNFTDDRDNPNIDKEDKDFDVLSLPVQKKRALYNKYEVMFNQVKEEQEQLEEPISYLGFMKITFNFLIFPTFIAVIADYIGQTFYLPVFPIEMKKKYSVDRSNASLYLSMATPSILFP
eukprot:CAMPEP_0170521934 /NCGR_PEP_ID=MMETSP0209-20121228/7359_1 /TAXON_ID=665100 ORGANISM="Litonotus pictus, Strain P1" /NCGR_SAMPLE_ID=MMETSP0209 /ASSEMBLY_ACC=CAM_ASM_000301 /LENGTH=145 /DNA_ID=CAMNT_0010809149 /DNA_START=689 /DNA_END=1127 /DNA_ORIENTATION=-